MTKTEDIIQKRMVFDQICQNSMDLTGPVSLCRVRGHEIELSFEIYWVGSCQFDQL